MARCDYYWFVGPFKPEYRIEDGVQPSATANIRNHHGEWKLGVYVDEESLPYLVRLSFPAPDSRELPEAFLPIIQIVKEHVQSVLRMMHGDRGISNDINAWNFRTEDAAPELKIDIREEFHKGTFDPGLFNGILSNTMSTREELRLYLDGTDERIPLQYRFLSLYKILELHFTKAGIWQEDELRAALEPHEEKLREIGIKKTLRNHLAELRDKCAHIKTRGRQVEIGVTHLNHKQLAEVQETLPILAGICRGYLNRKWDGKVSIGEPLTKRRVVNR